MAIIDEGVFGAEPMWLHAATDEGKGNSRVTAVQVSPDGRWVASGDEAGAIRLWDLWAFDACILGNLSYYSRPESMAWEQLGVRPDKRNIDERALQAWTDKALRHKE